MAVWVYGAVHDSMETRRIQEGWGQVRRWSPSRLGGVNVRNATVPKRVLRAPSCRVKCRRREPLPLRTWSREYTVYTVYDDIFPLPLHLLDDRSELSWNENMVFRRRCKPCSVGRLTDTVDIRLPYGWAGHGPMREK